MKINLTSVSIGDLDHALTFYTEKLGFIKKQDVPLGGGNRWLTVVSPDDPGGTELVLEPNGEYPAMKALKEALRRDKIPFTAFEVEDTEAEHSRLKALGVEFLSPPADLGEVIGAVLDDTCGNYILIYQVKKKG